MDLTYFEEFVKLDYGLKDKTIFLKVHVRICHN